MLFYSIGQGFESSLGYLHGPRARWDGANLIYSRGLGSIPRWSTMNDDFDITNTVCPCGKLYKDFDTCPICGEKTCFDCDDWEKHHEENATPYGEEDITSPS